MKDHDSFSDEEAQRRFQALVRSALNTPPQPKTGAKASKAAKRTAKK